MMHARLGRIGLGLIATALAAGCMQGPPSQQTDATFTPARRSRTSA
jgi:hypothetical protein